TGSGFTCCLLRRDSGAQSRDGIEDLRVRPPSVRSDDGPYVIRDPYSYRRIGKHKFTRHHSNDRERVSVDLDATPESICSSSKTLEPKAIGEKHFSGCIFLIWCEQRSHQRFSANNRENARRQVTNADAAGVSNSGNGGGIGPESANL